MTYIQDAMQWFKSNFHLEIEKKIKGTPITLDLLTALAYLETGEIWNVLRQKNLTISEILSLCNGDTIEHRSAFPKSYEELDAYVAEGNPIGKKMFLIARKALKDMAYTTGNATYIAEYNKPSGTKCCHGFGIFQYDIQYFKEDPNYFLNEDFKDFSKSLEKCLKELLTSIKTLGYDSDSKLSSDKLVHIAIAYNTGHYDAKKGLKQGYYNQYDKSYYGEKINEYLKIAQSVPTLKKLEVSSGQAIIPSQLVPLKTGTQYNVNIVNQQLRLRSKPDKSNNNNVIAHLPDGHLVQSINDKLINGFREVETYLSNTYFRGFLYNEYLIKTNSTTELQIKTDKLAHKIPEVEMPRKNDSTITKRIDPPGAFSLNEIGQPKREGNNAKELCKSLANIIDWLNVEIYTRYKPIKNGKVTYCNIYAHDYCYLAGVYLPRVWWTNKAIALIESGTTVSAKYADTISELTANLLFAWLKDFGEQFGWQRVDSATKLQTLVNQGAVGLIVAKRIQNEGPGHIVAVVPETDTHQAKRDAKGIVTQPLQSQAGAVNFCYGVGTPNWWLNENKFEASAFWVHS